MVSLLVEVHPLMHKNIINDQRYVLILRVSFLLLVDVKL